MPVETGFIGVGRMGSAMATNLLASNIDVTVYDVDQDRVDAITDAGADEADSIRECVESMDIVFTSLPDSESVETVYLDTDGVLDAAADGTILVELSTVKPETIETIKTEITDRREAVDLADTPVIGIPSTARAAELTILVGASDDAFRTIEPVLEHLGNEIVHVGSVGQAKAVKLLNNVLTYGNYAVAAEAFALASRYDINQREFFDIVDSGAASSSIVASKIPNVFKNEFEPGFTVEGAIKDLDYAVELGDEVAYEMPIAEIVKDQYKYAAERGRGMDDYSALLVELEAVRDDCRADRS